jgi:hypothetical protein
MKNKNLHKAKSGKNDEFYTQLSDIEKELSDYKSHFKGKTIYCNCDNPETSNFWKYFVDNFNNLGLLKLTASFYDVNNNAYSMSLDSNDNLTKSSLIDGGDFRSDECVELLKQADIVVTNPPFSLFREYVAQLVEHDKKFVIVGNQNAITYKEIFKLIKENKLWLGRGFSGGAAHFINKHYVDYATAGDHKEGMIRVSGVVWFTNLELKKRHENLILYKTYYGNESDYPTYDNYDAINVDKTKDIPLDYAGAMGVPITFLDKYNPEQFEILGNLGSYAPDGYSLSSAIFINGRKIYKRILIKNRKL